LVVGDIAIKLAILDTISPSDSDDNTQESEGLTNNAEENTNHSSTWRIKNKSKQAIRVWRLKRDNNR